jgi:hypothetical protein
MKTLLLTLVLFIAGCGTNITQKAESSEPPKLISHVKVEFVRNSKTPYKIQKYGIASNYGPSGPQITGDDKLATQKTVGDFLRSLSTNVETILSEKLHQRNVQVGDEYMLRIFMDEIVVSIQGEKALIKVSPLLNIKYSAILYRTSDPKTLWQASFRRPNGSTSPADLQSTGIEIAEKIFSEFSKSGWIN